MPHTSGSRKSYKSRPGHPAGREGGTRAAASRSRAAPARSNAGGAVRGQARAKQVQALNVAKRAARPAARPQSAPRAAVAKRTRLAAALKSNPLRARTGTPATAPARQPGTRVPIPVPQIELYRSIEENIRKNLGGRR